MFSTYTNQQPFNKFDFLTSNLKKNVTCSVIGIVERRNTPFLNITIIGYRQKLVKLLNFIYINLMYLSLFNIWSHIAASQHKIYVMKHFKHLNKVLEYSFPRQVEVMASLWGGSSRRFASVHSNDILIMDRASSFAEKKIVNYYNRNSNLLIGLTLQLFENADLSFTNEDADPVSIFSFILLFSKVSYLGAIS